jgi:hypothetical protein
VVADDTPRIRRAPLPDNVVLVVRGDVLDADVLRTDAARFARRYPRLGWLGVSAFYAANDSEVDALCQTKLSRFADVVLFQRTDLDGARIRIVGTFRTPHVTLAAEQVETLVARLLNCPHTTRTNPYYEAETSEEDR